jgi:hypothetical protein
MGRIDKPINKRRKDIEPQGFSLGSPNTRPDMHFPSIRLERDIQDARWDRDRSKGGREEYSVVTYDPQKTIDYQSPLKRYLSGARLVPSAILPQDGDNINFEFASRRAPTGFWTVQYTPGRYPVWSCNCPDWSKKEEQQNRISTGGELRTEREWTNSDAGAKIPAGSSIPTPHCKHIYSAQLYSENITGVKPEPPKDDTSFTDSFVRQSGLFVKLLTTSAVSSQALIEITLQADLLPALETLTAAGSPYILTAIRSSNETDLVLSLSNASSEYTLT